MLNAAHLRFHVELYILCHFLVLLYRPEFRLIVKDFWLSRKATTLIDNCHCWRAAADAVNDVTGSSVCFPDIPFAAAYATARPNNSRGTTGCSLSDTHYIDPPKLQYIHQCWVLSVLLQIIKNGCTHTVRANAFIAGKYFCFWMYRNWITTVFKVRGARGLSPPAPVWAPCWSMSLWC